MLWSECQGQRAKILADDDMLDDVQHAGGMAQEQDLVQTHVVYCVINDMGSDV